MQDLPAGWNLHHTYATLPDHFHARVDPHPVRAPRLVILNTDLARELGLDLADAGDEALAQLFAGNVLPPGATPLAQAYAGHQFGNFAMLGDGRAHLLGEQRTPDGQLFDIQLKGSGPTPFSRRGDGRAALGPMLREFIISEAMQALGIPTTRSLAVVATGEPVYREEVLQGAVLVRVASSHLRVGTFEYAAGCEDLPGLKALADYAIARHDPDLAAAGNPPLAFLHAVISRQARLVASWMAAGFVHGVMNTDNMTISGETIDYGPCAFMDRFAFDTVFSSIDRNGRYAWANQARMAQWNLARLAGALLPLIDDDDEKAMALAREAVDSYGALFNEAWTSAMGRKLGLAGHEDADRDLIQQLLEWMHASGADYTGTFRDLMAAGAQKPEAPRYDATAFHDWHAAWQARLAREPGGWHQALARMRTANPAVIPRNHRVEEALRAAEAGDMKPFADLLAAVRDPFSETQANADFRAPPAVCDPAYRTFCGT